MRATPRRTASRPAPGVVRLGEAEGSSRTGFDGALKAAVKAARAEIDDPIAVELARQWADLGPRGVTTYHVSVKVAYRQALAAPKRERSRAAG